MSIEGMKRIALLSLLAIAPMMGLTSCGPKPEPKPVGPTSETSKIPWNRPIAGQGQGSFGMVPGSQFRR